MDMPIQSLQSGLLVTVGNTQVVIHLKYFHELVEITSLIPLSQTVPWFKGIQTVRGRIAPLTNLEKFLQRDSFEYSPSLQEESAHPKAIVLEYENELFGFTIPEETINVYYDKDADFVDLVVDVPAEIKPYISGMIRNLRNTPFSRDYEIILDNCPLLELHKIIRDQNFIDIRQKLPKVGVV